MSLISCRELSLGYDGRAVVNGMSFSVDIGDYLCIVGENGSGKSTLIKTLLGLIPPLGGEIMLGDNLKRFEIGYLPQQTDVQKDFPASVHEIVLSGCLNGSGIRPFYTKEQKKKVAENMDKLGISGLAKRCYRDLSGGQQQRVLLARALCATHRLLLLDEPTAGLDPNASSELYKIITKLNTEEKITIIMISHDVVTALEKASHILHIGDSRSLFFGKKADYNKSKIGSSYICSCGGKHHERND